MILELNTTLYPQECITQAIKDYKGVWEITVKRKGKSAVLSIKPSTNVSLDSKIIQMEFCNYVLSLVQSRQVFN